MVPSSLFLHLLNLHPMYFVLVLINRKPLDSNMSHQVFNVTLDPHLVLSTKSLKLHHLQKAYTKGSPL